MAKRRVLIDVEEGITKAKHDRPQRPPILRDEGSDDDFVDTPYSRSVVRVTDMTIDEQEARRKARNGRPQKPNRPNVKAPTSLIGKKRKVKDIVGNEDKCLEKKMKGKNVPSKASYPKLSTRTSPFSLVKSFQEMNES